MEQKNILLLLFLLVVGSGLYGQKNSDNNWLTTSDEPNAYLGSITWPDMPLNFKGEVAISYGWKGDTIPSFDSLTMNYVLILPKAYQMSIPALTFSTRHPNSVVAVKRAKSLGGSVAERTITFTVTAEDSVITNVYSVLLKKEQDTIDTLKNSTITSKFYKVSDGYSLNETIKGVLPWTPVSDFYSNITRVSELQTLRVFSAISGAELAAADKMYNGDTLVVVSADGKHTTKYILRVTSECLGCYTYLTSTIYTISVTGSTGTITGFPKYTLLKNVLAGVVIPKDATLTMVDQNDAYKTLVKLRFDTVYVNVQATSDVYFELIAENGMTKVLYQLMPISTPHDTYVTSDLYSVDQSASGIYYLLPGTSVASLFRNVTPAPGATMAVFDKEGFVRSSGIIYKDDRLVVTSKDGTTTKSYSFLESNFGGGGPYVAFVISDVYQIDQIHHTISGVPEGISFTGFRSKLYPGFGSTLKIIDANGNESALATIVTGDRLLVTSADGTQITTYSITFTTGIDPVDVASAIKIFPNPTNGKVAVHRLEKGNRLRVLNPAGIAVHDVIADSSTETISLDDQPAGMYIFVVSTGTQLIKIQKITKK